jgi:hypothetical protein
MNEEQNLNKPQNSALNIYLVIRRYLKMVLPSFGKFTNGMYDIVGVMWLGRLYGRCTKSRWNSVMNVGDWKNLPQYHLRSDTKAQFFK